MWLSRVVVKANSRNGSDITRIKPTPTRAKIGLLAPIRARPAAKLAKITTIQIRIWA